MQEIIYSPIGYLLFLGVLGYVISTRDAMKARKARYYVLRDYYIAHEMPDLKFSRDSEIGDWYIIYTEGEQRFIRFYKSRTQVRQVSEKLRKKPGVIFSGGKISDSYAPMYLPRL